SRSDVDRSGHSSGSFFVSRPSCRFRGPWGRYISAAVAVAGHCDAGRAGEHDPVVGEAPSLVTEATTHFFHPETVFARVLGPYPAHDPTPCMVVDRVEGGLGRSVPVIVRPSRQCPVDAGEKLIQAHVAG